MNLPSFFVIQAGKKRLIPLSSVSKEESNQRTAENSRVVFGAAGDFGKIVCSKYLTPFAEISVVHLETKTELIISYQTQEESLWVNYCQEGFFQLTVENGERYLIGHSQLHWVYAAEIQNISIRLEPMRGNKCVIFSINTSLVSRTINSFHAGITANIKNQLARLGPISFEAAVFTSSVSLQTVLYKLRLALEGESPIPIRVKAYASIALLEIADEIGERIHYKNAEPTVITDENLAFLIAEMIILGMDEPWDLEHLAVQNKINPKKLRDMFKKHVGMPTSVFKISIRIEKASHLLANTSLKIQDISLQVGYPNPAHFAKLFKLKTGRSPSKFRKESRMRGKKGTGKSE